MCGIVGFASNDENKGTIIKKMTDRISHRGPDEEGYYITINDMALTYRDGELTVEELNKSEEQRWVLLQ